MGLLGSAVGRVRVAPISRSAGGRDVAGGGGASWVGRGGGVDCGREVIAAWGGGVAGRDNCGRRGTGVTRGRRGGAGGVVCGVGGLVERVGRAGAMVGCSGGTD